MTEWLGLDTAVGELPPGFGKHDFIMTYETRMPCGSENSSKACYRGLFEEAYHGAVQGGTMNLETMMLNNETEIPELPEVNTNINISNMYFLVTTTVEFDADSGRVGRAS